MYLAFNNLFKATIFWTIACQFWVPLASVAAPVKCSDLFAVSTFTPSKNVSSLLDRKLYQEAIWTLRRQAEKEEANKVRVWLIEQMRLGNPVSKERIQKGTTGARLVTLDNGIKGVFKTNAETNGYNAVRAEVAAYRLSEALGLDLVPVTIFREIDGEFGSFQYFISNGRSPGNHDLRTNNLVFFDYLISPIDRFDGDRNWLFYGDSRQVAYDNGWAFTIEMLRNLTPTPGTENRLIPTLDVQKKLHLLTDKNFRSIFKNLLSSKQIEFFVKRKNYILQKLEEKI